MPAPEPKGGAVFPVGVALGFLLLQLWPHVFGRMTWGRPSPRASAGQEPLALALDCPALLDQKVTTLMDQPASLCQYQGKVVLVVNTASQCGFTPQYEGLEALYRRYKDRGLVILGFPSNDFGQQEPGANKEIAQFCQVNYGVSFPMFSKSAVVGPKAIPLYSRLDRKSVV